MTDELSKRERAVLSWLTHGLSNKEIGLALSISPRTVQKHLQRVYYHLGVQTRVEAIIQMYRRTSHQRHDVSELPYEAQRPRLRRLI